MLNFHSPPGNTVPLLITFALLFSWGGSLINPIAEVEPISKSAVKKPHTGIIKIAVIQANLKISATYVDLFISTIITNIKTPMAAKVPYKKSAGKEVNIPDIWNKLNASTSVLFIDAKTRYLPGSSILRSPFPIEKLPEVLIIVLKTGIWLSPSIDDTVIFTNSGLEFLIKLNIDPLINIGWPVTYLLWSVVTLIE